MNTNIARNDMMDALSQLESMLGPHTMLPLGVAVNGAKSGFISIDNAKKAMTNREFEYELTHGQIMRSKDWRMLETSHS